MGKRVKKTADFGGLIEEKTANALELAEVRLKRSVRHGIYAIGSRKMNLIGIWASRSVDERVRKFRSDIKTGKKLLVLEEMGLRFAPDVIFQVLETCSADMTAARLRHWAKVARERDYVIWNSWEYATGEVREKEMPESFYKVIRMKQRFGLDEAGMVALLNKLERGLEVGKEHPGLAPDRG